MLKVRIIAIGKIKEKAMKSLIDEYCKRLKAYCKLEIIELDDEKCPEKLSEKEQEQVREREAKRIEDKIPKDAFVIPLVIEGKKMSSTALSRSMDRWQTQGKSHFCFIIGGSLGLSASLRKSGGQSLSFSDMTFPHNLMRLILVEQIYRSFRISRGEPYHK